MLTAEQMNVLINNHELTEKLIEAHSGKSDKVTRSYHNAFKKMMSPSGLNYKPTFSVWAFFTMTFYFLYRKLYIVGVVLFIATNIFVWIATSIVAVIFSASDILTLLVYTSILSLVLLLAVQIIHGVLAKYYYLKKFLNDLHLSGFGHKELPDIIASLRNLGGYNNWVVVLFVILIVLFILTLVILSVGFYYVIVSSTMYGGSSTSGYLDWFLDGVF